ncbi:MAG: formylglycine-generating enzyme family protein, partial [Planctomycetia bacterium]|nr:formylglycine-generating enzyme family protein [Planctomycetia bacterium]
GTKLRLTMPPGRYGAIVAVREKSDDPALARLLEQQQAESRRPVPPVADDPRVRAKPVLDPISPPAVAAPVKCPKPDARGPMLAIEGGPQEFTVRHARRECGCYPDPGTPPAEWPRFLTGENFDEKIEHHVRVDLAAYEIDARPVTNAQYEAFLKASGYRPASPEHFIEHWGGPECPAGLRDEPVVYVDPDDARAYAAWAGLRLPTEWQWHAAARKHGEGFQRDAVHEWTESVRDDGHTRFVMLRSGCRYDPKTSSWYFPGGPQPIDTHAKFLLMHPGLDRSATIGFRCVK